MNIEKRALLKLKIFRWVKVIVLLYAIFGIALYYTQDLFLFHPEKLPANYSWNFKMPFKELAIAFNEKDSIDLVKFIPKDSVRKGLVLYFHGNKENIGRYAKFANIFTEKGYEVWMEDYPEFGKSTGIRNEKKLNEQAMAIYTMAAGKFGKDSIIIYGKSFGTGIAAYVASQSKCKRLILETPYYSIPALFSCYAFIYPTQRMAMYKIPVNEYLAEVNYPITIFHGTNDGVIPYRCAAKLKSVLKPSDQFITIEKGTHHNLATFNIYKKTIDSLLNF